jgi:hypothetical protein
LYWFLDQGTIQSAGHSQEDLNSTVSLYTPPIFVTGDP